MWWGGMGRFSLVLDLFFASGCALLRFGVRGQPFRCGFAHLSCIVVVVDVRVAFAVLHLVSVIRCAVCG